MKHPEQFHHVFRNTTSCGVISSCGSERMWLALSNLGKNRISFSKKLGRGVSASITLGFFQQNTFWFKTWFVKHTKNHEWRNIKPEACSICVSTTVQLRTAKRSAQEAVSLPQSCRNILLEWKAHSSSLQWVLIHLKVKTLDNIHTSYSVWAGGTFGGAIFGATSDSWDGLDVMAPRSRHSEKLISYYLLGALKITNDETENIPVQLNIPACNHLPSHVHYKILSLGISSLSTHQNNPNCISPCLFFFSLVP